MTLESFIFHQHRGRAFQGLLLTRKALQEIPFYSEASMGHAGTEPAALAIRWLLVPFSAGAFIPGVPVQPVVLRYPNKLVSVFSCGPVFRQRAWK